MEYDAVDRKIKSFTIIELVIIIAVIGILASFAIPSFIRLKEDAYRKKELLTVDSIRKGIWIWWQQHGKKWPSQLDDAHNGECSKNNPFFTYVLEKPVVEGWRKKDFEYRCILGKGGKTYVYNPQTGKFEEEE